jgi:hypothetical protein
MTPMKTPLKTTSSTKVRLPDCFELAHPGNGIRNPPRLEIAQRQTQQMLKDPCTQFHVNTAARVREQVVSNAAQNGFEKRNQAKTDDQHVESGKAAMDQDFVDDDLKKKRRDQPETLQKNDATRTSTRVRRYFLTAPRNHVRSKRRCGSLIAPLLFKRSRPSAARPLVPETRRDPPSPGRRRHARHY